MGFGGIAVREGEASFSLVCETAGNEVSVLYSDLTMSGPATLADRVAADLKSNATEVSFKTIEATGAAIRGQGRLFGQEVDQVITPVTLLGLPRTQLVRGRIDGTKACMVSVIYDPKVITDPAVLEPLFAAPED